MKKFLSAFLIVILFVISCFAVGIVSLSPASADSAGSSSELPTDKNGDPVITNSWANNVNFSKSLYAVLSRIYTEKGNTLGEGGSFPTNAFNNFTALDLTIGQGELTNWPTDNKITSLVGMEYLSFNNLRTLKIDGHDIEIIYEDDLSSLNALETLYITNSNVTEIAFPTSVAKLNYLDLSGNELTEVDVSKCLAKQGSTNPYLNVSENLIEKATKIKLPTSYNLRELNVNFNKLDGVKATDFTADKVSILLQGFKPGDELVYGQKIYMQDGTIKHSVGGSVQNDTLTNLNAKIFFSEDSQYATTFTSAVAETDTTGYITIPCGKLVLKFYQGQTEITNISTLNATKYSVLPPAPTVKGYVGNQELLTLSSSENITLKAELNLTGTSLDEFIKTNSVVKMKVGNNSEYEAGAVKDFTTGGKFAVSTIVTFDGLSSTAVSLDVQKNDLTGLTWVLIIVVIIIGVVGALYFLLGWVRNGAVVAPLTDKETRRIYQKQGREYYVSDHRNLLEDEGGETSIENSTQETNNSNNDNDDEVIGL